MDARKERSRAAVIAAFYQLIAQKDYGKITVADLLATSGIARATFYSQFRGKADVLAATVEDLCAHTLDDGADLRAEVQVRHALANLWERRECVRALVSGEGAQLFADCLRHAVVARADRCVPQQPKGPAAQINRSFLLHHIAAAFVGAVQWWAWHGFTASAEEVETDLLRALSPLFQDPEAAQTDPA